MWDGEEDHGEEGVEEVGVWESKEDCGEEGV